MPLVESELKIVTLEELLKLKLRLPDYQRPYRWTEKSANTLFQDIYEAFEEEKKEYRIGSVILHKKESEYDIVDGQQRMITNSILLHALGDDRSNLLKANINLSFKEPLLRNFFVLKRRLNELKTDERKRNFKNYLLKNSTIVQIVTDSEQDAFQFFDSQNSRGKELAPHDLLKSFHLREMHDETEESKVSIIRKWEATNSEHLEDLFKNYLYPLTQWYKGNSGLGYSSSRIDLFKGILGVNRTNYAIYHKASNLYIEQFNSTGGNELIGSMFLNQFQLTQPVLSGKRFFQYALHYGSLLEKIQFKIKNNHPPENVPTNGSGEIYIKQLYESVLMFFVDRFGLESLNDFIFQQLYSWCYSLRLVMHSVYPETVNKYARGEHERLNYGMNLFTIISEMKDPSEIKLLIFEKPSVIKLENKNKYESIVNTLNKINGWDL
ncbi:DUF262 domain-containing protein [Leptospira bouyouniensis]|uniref:DUF262 domain-containing protein n=1 Tax=Leptospira bouyouniensis TaxID=2484911 RepID=A0A7I0IQ96_9LEPT|nr:DUF262 domain-containing protein [Leptospira bouyouniensis]TGL06710.1 DUF262 domain-containing protein [Leptospira bouyouniensis]